jgi:aminopeptidase N
VRELIW